MHAQSCLTFATQWSKNLWLTQTELKPLPWNFESEEQN